MFASLLGAVRADIDRQVGWAKDEARRQARHTVLIEVVASVAALAALGAIVVAFIALYLRLAMEFDPYLALAIIGGGLLLLALILFVLAFMRPRPADRPRVEMIQPAAIFGTLGQGGGEQTLKLVSDAVRHSPRSTLVGTLALVAVLGIVAGRRR